MYKELKIPGRTLYVAFNLRVVLQFQKEYGKEGSSNNDLEKLIAEVGLEGQMKLFYMALKEGHRKAKKDFDMEFDPDFFDFLDDNPEAIEEIANAFNDSIPQAQETEQKKTQRSTKKSR
jgi:hypothetical protein